MNPSPPHEHQVGGDHYKRLKPEPIDVIQGWKLGFELGNALKYIARHKFKGNEVEDIDKAIHYLELYRRTLTVNGGVTEQLQLNYHSRS